MLPPRQIAIPDDQRELADVQRATSDWASSLPDPLQVYGRPVPIVRDGTKLVLGILALFSGDVAMRAYLPAVNISDIGSTLTVLLAPNGANVTIDPDGATINGSTSAHTLTTAYDSVVFVVIGDNAWLAR